MWYVLFLLLAVTFAVILNLQFRLFTPASRKVRILEYHSISTDGFEDQITISKEKMIAQLDYLKKNNYKTLWLSELEEHQRMKKPLPPKTVVLTFDDGFLDTYTELFPLLQQYNFKAVCFLVLGKLGKNIDWAGKYVKPNTLLMNKEQIHQAASHIEFGYHTYKHDNYAQLSFEEIDADLKQCQKVIEDEGLKVYPALAYTFGRYFRKKDEKQKRFFEILLQNNIRYALRIGNRINTFPFASPYEIQRIDIRGTEDMKTFQRRLILGRKKLF